MVKNKIYKNGYTLEKMIHRVLYWWSRYEGTRTEDGKDYSLLDLGLLLRRLTELRMRPDNFDFDKPEMGVEY